MPCSPHQLSFDHSIQLSLLESSRHRYSSQCASLNLPQEQRRDLFATTMVAIEDLLVMSIYKDTTRTMLVAILLVTDVELTLNAVIF